MCENYNKNLAFLLFLVCIFSCNLSGMKKWYPDMKLFPHSSAPTSDDDSAKTNARIIEQLRQHIQRTTDSLNAAGREIARLNKVAREGEAARCQQMLECNRALKMCTDVWLRLEPVDRGQIEADETAEFEKIKFDSLNEFLGIEEDSDDDMIFALFD